MIKYYDYPEREDRAGIFSACDDNYFLKSERFTYLCSYEEARRADKQNSFLGSFVLVTYKRLAVIKKGELYFMNKDFSDGNMPRGRYKDGGFVVIRDEPISYYIHSWDKYLESYEVRDDSEYNKALKVSAYSCAEVAIDKAISLSKEDGHSYIVACWFDDFDRH